MTGPTKRDIHDRLSGLEDNDEEDETDAVCIYDSADADEPRVIIGGEAA